MMKYPKSITVVVALVFVGVLTQVSSQQDTPSQSLPKTGQEVYAQYYCGMCHQLDAAGTKGTFGPTHNAMRNIASERIQDLNYRGAAVTIEAYLRESILQPEAYIVPGYVATPHRMPAYTQLSDHELDALVLLLMHQ
jgi:mono/diheme cytochrome c family protein